MRGSILVACLLTVALATNFNITSTSTCTATNTQGFCTNWQQSGRVIEDYGSCFPAHAQVMTPQGLSRMDQLRKGSQILALQDGNEVFTEVTSWFHHNPAAEAEYLQISTEVGQFEVSAKHNIALNDMTYLFASELEGQILLGAGPITGVTSVKSSGLYSPKTRLNNYFVYLGAEAKVLAHCFAHIRNPENYEVAVSAIESLWELFGQTADEVHPSYTWMQQTFAFLQE